MNKKLMGTVISNKLAKTVTVQFEVVKKAPKYGKSLRLHKKLLAHVSDGTSVEIGNRVAVVSCRPYSKSKHFKVVEVLS